MPKAVEKKKKVYAARNFSTLLQQSTNEIPKTLAADNTDITTQIYTGMVSLII
jgi:hypothetical protein